MCVCLCSGKEEVSLCSDPVLSCRSKERERERSERTTRTARADPPNRRGMIRSHEDLPHPLAQSSHLGPFARILVVIVVAARSSSEIAAAVIRGGALILRIGDRDSTSQRRRIDRLESDRQRERCCRSRSSSSRRRLRRRRRHSRLEKANLESRHADVVARRG